MHCAVEEILPSINKENANEELDGRDDDPVDQLGSHYLPSRKGRDLDAVGTTSG